MPVSKPIPSESKLSALIWSAWLGESSQRPDVAAWANIRFGSVGPAMEACQLSHSTNSLASWCSTGTYFGSKHRIGSPGLVLSEKVA